MDFCIRLEFVTNWGLDFVDTDPVEIIGVEFVTD